MTDAIGDALRAAAAGSPSAYPLAFAAGLATSIGPCVAPRYVAVAALAQASRNPARVVVAFVAGTALTYVALASLAAAIGTLWSASHLLYAGFAVLLAVAGAVSLVRADGKRVCARHAHGAGGAPFLLGASSALVVSPCCTPVVAALAGLTALSGHAAAAAMLSVAFAFGHGLPLIAAGMLGGKLAPLFARAAAAQAPAIVSGALLLALAAYYGVLA
ncbi:MAG: hypothetical protein JO164_01935 [Candidatus Eremiobacteraeota bacterium]|nr:hypothetical protein [Candidatus Eremiobacteraeota bacterium]